MEYDSTTDTLKHKIRVASLLLQCARQIIDRADSHDNSKLQPQEKAIFDEFTPKLKACTYGSDEYGGYMKEMQVALKHHYEVNAHHPEHWPNGITDMNLLDILEMFCDWKAATERHADGNLMKSIEINRDRFDISDQLVRILLNTATRSCLTTPQA